MSENIVRFPDKNDVLPTLHLKGMKVFVHTSQDAVLLRVRTSQPDDTWYSLRRSDFIELASYLADNAGNMSPN